MADKLSERLEAEAARTKPTWTKAPTMNPPTKPVHDARVQALLREAAEMARRVEGAAVVEMPSRSGPALQGASLVIGAAAAERMELAGQRVRLVPEPPGQEDSNA